MNMKLLLQGIGIGAGLMYFWDPYNGRRRRGMVLDQVDHARHCTENYFDKVQRDLSNRAAGVTAETRSLMRRDHADDRVIAARVRSTIGRYSSHPHAIRVESQNGNVVLSGQILGDEVSSLLRAVRWVRGVKSVENRMEVHSERGNVSALQGGIHRTGQQYDFMQENWSPATRAISQLTGLAFMGNCWIRRDLPSVLLGTAGLGLFLRGTMNRSMAQLTGMETCPPAARFQRTVTIHAPVEKVWHFITDFEELGRFMPSVKSVQDLGDGRYRWGFQLPGDQELEMEERITERVPNERLSWESVSLHPVSYSGTVTLQQEGEETTRVNVDCEYTPPGGALATAFASAFGVGPDSQFQDAVMRIKSFLETGNRPHDLHEVNADTKS